MAIAAISTQSSTVPPGLVAGATASPVKTAVRTEGAAANSPVNSPANSQADLSAGPPSPEEDLSFWDVLDIVNPLQHIPLINRAYRALTGDEIKPSTQVMGDILYGGVIGGMASIANAVLEQSTGKDATGHLLAAVGIGDDKNAPTQLTASAKDPANSNPAAPPANLAAAPAAAGMAGRAATDKPTTASRPTAGAAPPLPAVTAANASAASNAQANKPISADAVTAAVNKATMQPPPSVDPATLAASGHRPSKMPVRDMMLNTAMPPGSANAHRTIDNPRAADSSRVPTAAQPVDRRTVSGPQAAGAASPATAAGTPIAASAVAPANDGMPPQAVGRDAMAETMARNLAKYRSMNGLTKGQQTGTSVNTSS